MDLTNVLQSLDKIELNLGIKRLTRFTMHLLKEIRLSAETSILEPFYGILGRYLARRVIKYYGADYLCNYEQSQNVSKKEGNLGYGTIYYSIIRNLKPKKLLCIGSMYGYIPFILALGCKHNSLGHVDFVDAGYDINDKSDAHCHNFGQGFWKKINISKHFSYLNVSKYITSYIMTSEKFAQTYPDNKFDFIHIDGDHRYEGAKKDFQIFWKRLNRKGLMVFHDIEKKGVMEGIKFGYRKLWNEIKQSHKSYIVFPNPISGIGILQKE